MKAKKTQRPKLRAVWSKRERDIMFHYPTSPDGHLLNSFFDHVSIDGRTLRQQLVDRGYDIATLKFSIERFTEGKCAGGHAQAWDRTKKRWVPCQDCQEDEWWKDQVWRHESGLTLRVIGPHVPGDRNDEPRVWCEVTERASERLTSEKLADGYVDYEVGHRDGWYLQDEFCGWKRIS